MHWKEVIVSSTQWLKNSYILMYVQLSWRDNRDGPIDMRLLSKLAVQLTKGIRNFCKSQGHEILFSSTEPREFPKLGVMDDTQLF
jgi:hypothetical protein